MGGVLRAGSGTAVVGDAGGPDWHAEENNPKGRLFHRGVPRLWGDQLCAASAQRACTSDSVRTRADCLAASKMRVTSASSAGWWGRAGEESGVARRLRWRVVVV